MALRWPEPEILRPRPLAAAHLTRSATAVTQVRTTSFLVYPNQTTGSADATAATERRNDLIRMTVVMVELSVPKK